MTLATALVVGNSDGIGLELTRLLLGKNYRVLGLSRSSSPIVHSEYRHQQADVTHEDYETQLRALLHGEAWPKVVVYCAAIGASSSIENLAADVRVFDVNLMGAVRTSAFFLPRLHEEGGHFVVLSSQADVIVNPLAASYSASKAALSSYFEGLGLALRNSRAKIVNVRFGFVDTKLARAGYQPFRMTREKAAEKVYRLIAPRAPLRFTSPLRTALLVFLIAVIQRLRVACQR